LGRIDPGKTPLLTSAVGETQEDGTETESDLQERGTPDPQVVKMLIAHGLPMRKEESSFWPVPRGGRKLAGCLFFMDSQKASTKQVIL